MCVSGHMCAHAHTCYKYVGWSGNKSFWNEEENSDTWFGCPLRGR